MGKRTIENARLYERRKYHRKRKKTKRRPNERLREFSPRGRRESEFHFSGRKKLTARGGTLFHYYQKQRESWGGFLNKEKTERRKIGDQGEGEGTPQKKCAWKKSGMRRVERVFEKKS